MDRGDEVKIRRSRTGGMRLKFKEADRWAKN